MMEANIPRLIDAICEGWTKCLQPPYGDGEFSAAVDKQTDCNRFVNFVAERMGYTGLAGIRANDIVDHLKANKSNFLEISMESAKFYADKGYFVVAAWKNPDATKSGHVAVVRPGEAVTSNKWGVKEPKVPKIANVGPVERCRIDRAANWAFGEQPIYFVMKAANDGTDKAGK